MSFRYCRARRSWTGGIANQNRGTIGGNIVNASPAADSLPALLVYGAELILVSVRGERRVPYSSFHTGLQEDATGAGRTDSGRLFATAVFAGIMPMRAKLVPATRRPSPKYASQRWGGARTGSSKIYVSRWEAWRPCRFV